MPSYCCVLKCSQRGCKSKSGEKVSFFNFPKEPLRRKRWLNAIRRDEGKEFLITDKTKVCSLHLKPRDMRKTLNGKINLSQDSVPSKFNWSGASPKKRKPPTEWVPLPSRQKQHVQQLEEQITWEEEPTVDETSDLQTEEILEAPISYEIELIKLEIAEMNLNISQLNFETNWTCPSRKLMLFKERTIILKKQCLKLRLHLSHRGCLTLIVSNKTKTYPFILVSKYPDFDINFKLSWSWHQLWEHPSKIEQ